MTSSLSPPVLPDFEWSEEGPPPVSPNKAGGHKQVSWQAFVGVLMSNPGRWARLPNVNTSRQATMKEYGCEAVVRGSDVWVRWTAPGGDT